MKNILKIFSVLIYIIIFSNLLEAQEIGKAWEFNEDGNFEGIIIGNSLQDSSVADGFLHAKVSGTFPSISSEVFEIEAADYGYFQIRMKLPGATSGKIMWYNDKGVWGFMRFEVNGDSSFHDFNIPVYLSDKWNGKITQIMRLDFNPPLGSEIAIDYIRIVRIGQQPAIDKLLALRSVIKEQADIPFFAVVKNKGDIQAQLSSKLTLPEGAILISGELNNEHGILFKEVADTIKWKIRFNSLGKYDVKLKLFSNTDTTEKILKINVTDEYWKQNEFLLSAWSPPYAWYPAPYEDSVFSYYKNANFDNALWVRDDDALIQKIHQFDLKYFLLITPIFGEPLLRGIHDEIPPDITEDMLLTLDAIIDKYKNDPNLLGYHICDEPHIQAFKNIEKVVTRIREKDPTRLSFVNIWPNVIKDKGSASYIDKLLQTTKLELLSYDRYNFYNGYDGGEYFSNLSLIRRYALKYDVPFCNIIQAIGTNGTEQEQLNWRTPSQSEHRWLVYSSLTYGVHALIWFHWHNRWGLTGNPDRENIYPSIQSINAEIDSLKNIMVHLNTTEVYHTTTPNDNWKLPENGIVSSVSNNANLLIGYFKDGDDKDYFMLMNKDYNDSSFTQITLNYILDSLEVFNVEINKWEQVPFSNGNSGSTFNVHFHPGGGKLFKINGQSLVGVKDFKKIPTEFKLEQNYPNPFNPTTTIKYSIHVADAKFASTTNVVLKVYDVLGREVRTLVNKEQKPGNYKVNFNAGNLSSGIYFYRLTVNEFSQTKKIILLR